MVTDPTLLIALFSLVLFVLWIGFGFLEQVLLILRLLVRTPFRPPVRSPFEETELRLRVGLGDCDPNLHMTNSRYLVIADEARFDLFFRAGFGPALRRGMRTVVGTTCIRYRRDLPIFRPYTVRTRLVAWDDKWIYMENRFVRDGRTAVHVLSKSMPLGSAGKVPPNVFLAELFGFDLPPSPELPENVRILLRDSDALMSPD